MNNPPAFPGKQKALLIKSEHSDIAKEYEIDQNGMTLRDYFAAKAMSLAYKINKDTNDANIGENHWVWDAEDWAYIAETAFSIADAMLRERLK